MGEYFRPWRRKHGVVVLFLACVLAAGWVRSLRTLDIVVIYVGTHTTFTLFAEQQLVGVQYHSPTVGGNKRSVPLWTSSSAARKMNRLLADERNTWHWKGWGFALAEVEDEKRHGGSLAFCIVPYWSLVIPLTVLSSWLLFSRPRTTSVSRSES